MDQMDFGPTRKGARSKLGTIVTFVRCIFAGLIVVLSMPAPGHAQDTAATAAALGSRFILVDQNGTAVTDKDFSNTFTLVAFGYTFCPDVCPTALAGMAAALDALGDEAKKVQPIFITIDPERDTPERLRDYVSNFYPRLIGLSGSPAMIARVAAGYHVKYKKVPAPDGDPEDYTLDHTASIFLMGPHGDFKAKFPHAMDPEAMARRIHEFLQ